MGRARANEIEIEYETFGDPAKPPLVLVMGFSLQMIAWDDGFCRALAERFHVIRFDNRDVGLSTKIEQGGFPNMAAIFGGDASTVAYSLDDMADDVAGLLDALGVPSAHVAGMSMGGMIAQLLSLRHPARVKSLCSIMSTTGDRAVGQATPAALGVLMTPAPTERAAYIDYSVALWRVLCSSGHPFDEARIRERAARGFDRSFYPIGAARQLAAIVSANDRTQRLAELRLPTLVIHGEDDPLITPSGGEATARAIPGAELMMIPAMGHELPEPVWPRVVDAIAKNASRAKA